MACPRRRWPSNGSWRRWHDFLRRGHCRRRHVFEGLGVWSAMSAEAAPIRSIHVSDAGRFGVARLDAKEQGVQAFGYVVPNRVIGRVLWQALASTPNVTLAVPAQLKHATR